ncbi:MAG: hydroxyethylthiazole kinase [Deltaproteobacteria bacterium]|nr:hydroxyethylthiazole kinase [Deltaproteobacteria bacterium]
MRASTKAGLIHEIGHTLDRVRARHPIVHSITNYVVMNFTANVLLALGASPIMAHAPEEMEEMMELADALVLNIGTLSAPWVDSMLRAASAAQRRSVPIVLDPVGAGASRFRTETARRLLHEAGPSVLRGNASEILALAGHSGPSRGVDSAHATDEAAAAATSMAAATGAVVAVTGARDLVTDGKRWVHIHNGHPLMGRVTGSGCAATAVLGAFCAVETDAWKAAAGGLVVFGIAGEEAARSDPRPGTYQVLLLDALDAVSPLHLEGGARIETGNAAVA